jgi:hypothetical protein
MQVFGDRLLFPADFVGRGDMSRGGLLLRCVDHGRELEYLPLVSAARRGPRPARLAPQPGILLRATRRVNPVGLTRSRWLGATMVGYPGRHQVEDPRVIREGRS